MPADRNDVIDLICLVYHEARNLSSVAKAQSRYAKLASLSGERHKAWQEMREMRLDALQTGLVKSAVWVFEDRFEVDMADLVCLFKEKVWRARCGGPKWSAICSRVLDLTKFTEPARIDDLYREILAMPHNTGSVADKLSQLRESGATARGQTRRV